MFFRKATDLFYSQKHVTAETLTIRKFGPEIKNRCTQEGLNREILASIPKFGLEIKNRYTQESVNRQKLASILKSGPEIKNRCTEVPEMIGCAASIRKFGLEIENLCSAIVPASRTARLQRSRGAQAGTGCHEGGIILSKKPPEWHLVTPQQRYRVRFKFSLPQSRTARLRQLLPPGCCN